MKVALALGSNKGDRLQNILRAISEIFGRKILSNILCSTLFENPALLMPESPSEWDCDFINCVISGDSVLALEALLRSVKDIEMYVGRQKGEKWAPREIDIDILYYGNLVYDDKEIVVPHAEILNRDFVLLPLKEVMPKFQHCGMDKYYNVTIEDIVRDKYGV